MGYNSFHTMRKRKTSLNRFTQPLLGELRAPLGDSGCCDGGAPSWGLAASPPATSEGERATQHPYGTRIEDSTSCLCLVVFMGFCGYFWNLPCSYYVFFHFLLATWINGFHFGRSLHIVYFDSAPHAPLSSPLMVSHLGRTFPVCVMRFAHVRP